MARVLIVDDSLVMRSSMEMIIKGLGHEVVGKAKNGKEAIKLYEDLSPEIATMDLTMPEMDGISAVKEIVLYDPGAKIIVGSALNQKESFLEALQSSAVNYLIKPVKKGKTQGSIR
ncbi:MAG: response regulator [bacterium]|nr:response regulator [bacterium]